MLAKDGDVAAQLRGAAAIRRVLSKEEDPPIDKVLGLGALPLLIKLLGIPTEGCKLIFEATWAITNIASGSADQTRAVVEGGGIPPLVRLLRCNVAEVRDQAVWALGNIVRFCLRHSHRLRSRHHSHDSHTNSTGSVLYPGRRLH